MGMNAKTGERPRAVQGHYDWGLLTVVTLLLLLGLVMVFSASYPRGLEGFDNPYYFVARQFIWLFVGAGGLVVAARIPYLLWNRWSVPLMGGTLLALLAVILIGDERLGSSRTYYQGSIQPSEAAKISVILYVSAWLNSKGARIRHARAGLLPFGVLMGIVSVLIVLQPEITVAVLIVVTSAIMLFVAGADLKQLAVIGAVAAATFLLVVQYTGYAAERISHYLTWMGDPVASEEWQVSQGVQALMRGGLFGRGLGNGLAQQTGYLPLSWSDNIFGVIGEELGLLGTLFVLLLFLLLAYRGLRIALRAPDNFGMLLATGITASLLLQALLNMAVIAAVSPPTGMTLPFVSYGGSSLVASLVGIGILLNISRFGVDRTLQTGEQTGRKAHERDDLGRGDRRPRLSGTGRRQTAHSFQSTTERFPWETAKPEQRRRAAAKSAQERK